MDDASTYWVPSGLVGELVALTVDSAPLRKPGARSNGAGKTRDAMMTDAPLCSYTMDPVRTQ